MTIDQKMQVVEISQPGNAAVLQSGIRPIPRVGDDQILIKVAAAGVNRPDILQRKGLYPPPKGASDIPGLEVAGHVIETGPGTSRFKVGQKVMALIPGGGYAQYALADEKCTLPVPDALTMSEAACVPETFFTVWHNVFERGQLQEGDVLLVHGGASGIGTTAIQLGKAFGAKVMVTAGSDEKCEACRQLGADWTINYHTCDFVEQVHAVTDGHGADVILDMIGGDYVSRNHQAAALDGRIVQIAFLNGVRAEIDLAKVMMKRLVHTGSTLRARSVKTKGAIAKALENRVWPLLGQRQLVPPIDSVFALADAAKAHERMESRLHVGKISLICDPTINDQLHGF